MCAKVSYWEAVSFLRNPEVIVIGAGLVGVNAAISLKEKNPDLDVLILERENMPLGASTRNAGFACFGSVTELLDDLEGNDMDSVFELLSQRFLGLNFLRNRVGDEFLQYQNSGGYEVFDKDEPNLDEVLSKIPGLNDKILSFTGLEDTFSVRKHSGQFKNFGSACIFNKHEGSLHPGEMMEALLNHAQRLGVRILYGMEVRSISENNNLVQIDTNQYVFESKKLIVCTNGFTKNLFPDSVLQPSRNQVLVTEKLNNLTIDSCYHYDKGYVYFRNINGRILIGGGRNIALEEETTSEYGSTKKIRTYLKNILHEKIGISKETKIDYEWSGIMGTGPIKTPILRKHSEHIIFAVRLGGMGVALGSLLGDKAAKILLTSTTK